MYGLSVLKELLPSGWDLDPAAQMSLIVLTTNISDVQLVFQEEFLGEFNVRDL